MTTIIDEYKQKLKENINKLVLIDDKKINLKSFGAKCSGKTSSINLLLKYFYEKSNGLSTEEDEFFSLMISDKENTYYFILIEKSPSDDFEVILDTKGEKERKKISDSKKFDEINDKNQIILKYSYSNEGIKQTS